MFILLKHVQYAYPEDHLICNNFELHSRTQHIAALNEPNYNITET